MSSSYKIRELRVELRQGVILIADVDSVESANKLLKELKEAKLVSVPSPAADKSGSVKENRSSLDDPASRLELRANLTAGSLSAKNILAFKDNVPQLLRPGVFRTVDAVLVLLFAVEGGLQNTSIDYESFKGLHDAQNIKSGSPLTMLLTNLRNAGYLDKKVYSTDRTLRLTAKGEKKAQEVLKELTNRNP